MRSLRFAAVVFAACCLTSVAEGQNLVTNSGFDSDVTGWSVWPTASIVWSPLDADANPASGSALVTNLSTTPGDGTGTKQCIEGLVGGQTYRVAADILVPGGQSNTGSAYLLVQWSFQTGCSELSDFFLSPAITTSTPDVWNTSVASGEAPPGTQSARLTLSIFKTQNSGTLDANFDNVAFEELLFGDWFESGDTSAWSSVIGGF